MYLLYLDESGDCSAWTEHDHFIIAGIGVYEFQIEMLRKQLREIQRKYFPEINIPIVFHTTDIHSGKKKYRKLSKETRKLLLDDLYNVIRNNRFPKVVIFGAVMGIESAKNPYEDRSNTFEEVISGFNTFLVEGYKVQRNTHKGYGNKGLIIIDKNREEQYRTLLDTFQEEGTRYGYLANIIDIPYFARCKDTAMLQLADLCSHAIFRKYERNDATYFDAISPRIYRTKDGRLFGLKHITTKDCDCVSCSNQKKLSTFND